MGECFNKIWGENCTDPRMITMHRDYCCCSLGAAWKADKERKCHACPSQNDRNLDFCENI